MEGQCADMIKMAEEPDPEGRNLIFEELDRAKPNEDVLEALVMGIRRG